MFQFASRLPTLSQDFIYWLHKMVEPRQNNRFPDAKTALRALQALGDLTRSPEVVLEPNFKLFLLRSNRYGEKLTQTIVLSNPVPNTLLEGKWEVAPHPHDPPHRPATHSWISIHPTEFQQNDRAVSTNIKCQVQVETSKLLEGEVYERQLLLHTNAALKPRSLTLKIYTAPLNHIKPLPYASLTLFLLLNGGLTWLAASGLISWFISAETPVMILLFVMTVGSLVIGIGGITIIALLYWVLDVIISEWKDDKNQRYYSLYDLFNRLFNHRLSWFLVGYIALSVSPFVGMAAHSYSQGGGEGLFYSVLGVVVDCLSFLLIISPFSLMYKNLARRGFKNPLIYTLLLLTVGFGSTIGISVAVGSLNSALLLALAGTGLPLALLILKPIIQQKSLMAKYCKSKELLIKP